MLLTDMVEFNHYVISIFHNSFLICTGLVQFSLNKVLPMSLKDMVEHCTETRLNSISCG